MGQMLGAHPEHLGDPRDPKEIVEPVPSNACDQHTSELHPTDQLHIFQYDEHLSLTLSHFYTDILYLIRVIHAEQLKINFLSLYLSSLPLMLETCCMTFQLFPFLVVRKDQYSTVPHRRKDMPAVCEQNSYEK